MANFLVVYAARQQQSRKISAFIGEVLERQGHRADIFNVRSIPRSVTPEIYHGVIIGAPVQMKNYPRRFKRWVQFHAPTLNEKPAAFFSVCLRAFQQDESGQRAERETVQNFFKKTGWHPQTWAIFGGALNYSRYNWLTKRILQAIAKKSGVKTNVSEDYEFTDWQQVKTFTEDFAEFVSVKVDPRFQQPVVPKFYEYEGPSL